MKESTLDAKIARFVGHANAREAQLLHFNTECGNRGGKGGS